MMLNNKTVKSFKLINLVNIHITTKGNLYFSLSHKQNHCQFCSNGGRRLGISAQHHKAMRFSVNASSFAILVRH